MADDEGLVREELAKKLDADLDDFMENLAKARKPDQNEKKAFNFDEWAKEIDKHPAFMKEAIKDDGSGELSEACEALAAMQYDVDDPVELAQKHKQDGNKQFQKKLYKWAIKCYTEGIKVNCLDREVNAVLYANRAACHVRIGNLRSAIRDCVFALKFKEKHEKALIRGAECLTKLGYPDEALNWLKDVDGANEKISGLISEAERKKKEKERDKRKNLLKEKKAAETERNLLRALESRRVKFGSKENPYQITKESDLDKLRVVLPGVENCRVKLDETASELVWPVLLVYPEFNETDLIQEFTENSTLAEHLAEVFRYPAEWDGNQDYINVDGLEAYTKISDSNEESREEVLLKLELQSNLGDILKKKDVFVQMGLPVVVILSNNSFRNKYLQNKIII